MYCLLVAINSSHLLIADNNHFMSPVRSSHQGPSDMRRSVKSTASCRQSFLYSSFSDASRFSSPSHSSHLLYAPNDWLLLSIIF
jgi:hypothetical protein